MLARSTPRSVPPRAVYMRVTETSSSADIWAALTREVGARVRLVNLGGRALSRPLPQSRRSGSLIMSDPTREAFRLDRVATLCAGAVKVRLNQPPSGSRSAAATHRLGGAKGQRRAGARRLRRRFEACAERGAGIGRCRHGSDRPGARAGRRPSGHLPLRPSLPRARGNAAGPCG